MRQGSKRAVETRNWASAGLSSTKSSAPVRTPSTTAVKLGVTLPSRMALSSENQPSTTSASGHDQPTSDCRCLNTTSSGTRVTPSQNSAIAPLKKKSSRYCIAIEAETPQLHAQQAQVAGQPPHRHAPKATKRRKPARQTSIAVTSRPTTYSHCTPSARNAAPVSSMPTAVSTGKPSEYQKGST